MTLEKIYFLCMKVMDGVFGMLEQCVISIDGSVSINLWELFLGAIVLFFFFRIAISFINGG